MMLFLINILIFVVYIVKRKLCKDKTSHSYVKKKKAVINLSQQNKK